MNALVLARECNRFWLALQFFTRLPLPVEPAYTPEELSRSSRYFPLVGLLAGGLTGLVLVLAALVWPPALAVVLALACGMWLTGAFHEDGLADTFDALGGAMDRERALAIMKDSRIGTYGSLALIIAVLAKFLALVHLAEASVGVAVLALGVAHPLSRAAGASIMQWLDYVRIDSSARAKPVAENARAIDGLISIVLGLLPLAVASFWLGAGASLGVLGTVALTVLVVGRWLRRRLGGYTGDGLGALQQLSEIVVYLTLLALL